MSRTAGSDGDAEDLREEVLTLLARVPRSGMELITAFAEREDDPRHVPPAVMYPLLDALTAEGLTRLSMAGGAGSRMRPFELTEQGWAHVRGGAEAQDQAPSAPETVIGFASAEDAPDTGEASVIEVRTRDTAPWDTGSAPTTPLEEATERLWRAVDETRRHATETQADRARELVDECTRELHELLVASGVRPE
ncbi:PadR family transcriptional regulator [Spiractinospora alimapuensis]|uniref:PadR family transcriptional regulator n=1 Tax=Spiractinospora alimapuensis TaxID=2820884 RepID=UPI001F3F86E4|nr:PadR family transcriptional regulator [Spiractinospora alimapuensis]QVQ51806.1 PadR family transcriptional regulator [Spiractinospora alimapuensis]